MVETDAALERLAGELGEALRAKHWRVACAESCTGGWIAKVLTDVPGSSLWFGWGFVSYANEAKVALLGVPAALLAEQGAVSEAVARAMAEGARRVSGAELGVAVTGVAGPDGGTRDKPVGTVWFAWADPERTHAERAAFTGDRQAVRRRSVAHALRGALERAGR